jgi:hypothetical protein
VKPAYLDVLLEINSLDLVNRYDASLTNKAKAEELSRELAEASTEAAKAKAHHDGIRIFTDHGPTETYIRRGSHVLAGGDFLLVATRWKGEVRESFDPDRANTR